MPTPKNKFLEAVWDRIAKEREDLALYRKHVRGTTDDVEKLQPEIKKVPLPSPVKTPKIKKEYGPLSQDQLAQISFMTWDHYSPKRIGELMGLDTEQVTQAIKKMKLERKKKSPYRGPAGGVTK